MCPNENSDQDKERIINFALLLQQIVNAEGIKYSITSQNQGIPEADIILIVEAWLEKMKDNFKDRFKKSMVFGKKE